MVLFIGHSSAVRLLRSLEDFEGIRAARAMPSSRDIPTLPKSFKESSPLATLPRPLEVVVSSGKQEAKPSSFITTFGSFLTEHLAFFCLRMGSI